MSFCVSCGNENTAGAKFCGSCGEAQGVTAKGCSKCGKKLEENEKFCSGCGTPVGKVAQVKGQSQTKTESDSKEEKFTKEGRKIIKASTKPSPANKKVQTSTRKSPPPKKSSKKKEKSPVGCFFRTLLILISIVLVSALIIIVINVIFIEDDGSATNAQKIDDKENSGLTDTNIPGIVDIEPEKESNPDKQGKSNSAKTGDKIIPDSKDINSADKYLYGIGVENNQYKAFELYEKLADKGDLDAMVHLSDYYEQGIWVKKDTKKAKNLLQQAADKGSISAKWQLEYLDTTNK